MLDDFNSGSNNEPNSAPLQPVELGGDEGAASSSTSVEPPSQPIMDNPYKVNNNQSPSSDNTTTSSQNEESKDPKADGNSVKKVFQGVTNFIKKPKEQKQ